MNDEEVRELLAALPHRSMVKHPHGSVAILRRVIQEAAADLAEVERWITAHAGSFEIAPAAQSHGLRPGRVLRRTNGPTPYYVVSKQALGLD